MSKKKKMLILGILLLAVLGTGIIAYTYSRYLSRAIGTADLKVATWAVKVNDTDITQSANFTLDESYITWSKSDYIAEGYIAPSRTGTMRLRLDTTGSKVAVKYTIGIDASVLDDYSQIKITKVNGEALGSGIYTGVIPLADVDTPIEIPIEIVWEDVAGNNESDTTIGSTVTKISIPITVTAEQMLGEEIEKNNYCIENGFNKLSDCMLIMENKSTTVDEAKSTIVAKGTPDFSQIAPPASGEDTVSGMYSTLDDDGTSYYYRGDVRNNYVSFAGYIWRIIRENGDGSVRMIYSGTSTTSTGSDLAIENSQYNQKYWDPTYVGYKYSEKFALNTNTNTTVPYRYFNGNADYYFGTGYTFDDVTKKFKLTGNTINGKWQNVYSQAIASYPYTCFSNSAVGTCDVMIKTTGYSNEYTAMVNLISYSSKDYASTLLNTMDTPIKIKLDTWYEANVLNHKDIIGNSYSNYISDEIFCNERSVVDGTGYLLTPTTTYATYGRLATQKAPTLKCKQIADKFSVSTSKGNASLKYPIGLITADEISMAGGLLNTDNTQYYLHTGQDYWTISPYSYNTLFTNASMWFIHSGGGLYGTWVTGDIGIRPVINLSSDVLISGGNGTVDNPYKVFIN